MSPDIAQGCRFTAEQNEAALKVSCPVCNAPKGHGCMMILWNDQTGNTSLQERRPHARRIQKALKFPNPATERRADGGEHEPRIERTA